MMLQRRSLPLQRLFRGRDGGAGLSDFCLCLRDGRLVSVQETLPLRGRLDPTLESRLRRVHGLPVRVELPSGPLQLSGRALQLLPFLRRRRLCLRQLGLGRCDFFLASIGVGDARLILRCGCLQRFRVGTDLPLPLIERFLAQPVLALPACEFIGFPKDGGPLPLQGLPLLCERRERGGEIVFAFRHGSLAFLQQALRALRCLHLRCEFRLSRLEPLRPFLGLGFASREDGPARVQLARSKLDLLVGPPEFGPMS